RCGFHGRDRVSSGHPGYLSHSGCAVRAVGVRPVADTCKRHTFARSCGGSHPHAAHPARGERAKLPKNCGLLIFAVCLLLFQLANASLLTQISQALPRVEGRLSSLVVSALVVFPQIIVAALAPWAGRSAATWGRKPLLIIGLAAVPIRST